MSSKSNARLPADPLISMRMAFLRPVANRVASKTPSAPPVNRARKAAASSTVTWPRSVPAVPDRPACSARQRPLLDEGLELAGHRGDRVAGDELGEVDDVGADVAERAGAGLVLVAAATTAAPRGRRSSPGGTAPARAGSSPIRPSATSWRASAMAGHPAVGEADHRAHAVAAPPSRPPRPSPRPPRPCWPAASRTARACRPPARRSRSRRGCRPACRRRPGRCRRASTRRLPVGLGLVPAEPVGGRGDPLGVAAADDAHRRGCSGRSKKRGAVRQAWEWAAPMKA